MRIHCTIKNNKSHIQPFLVVCGLLFFVISCTSVEEYSEIPSIEYKSARLIASQDELGNQEHELQLTFRLFDGDGDIGLADFDTVAPYVGDFAYNFFPKLYVKYQGRWVISDSLSVKVSNYRIPYVGELGEYPALEADITVAIRYATITYTLDTVKCEFYMLDRALHMSNRILSPEIILSSK